jgi:hypothetical protein
LKLLINLYRFLGIKLEASRTDISQVTKDCIGLSIRDKHVIGKFVAVLRVLAVGDGSLP